MRQVAGRQACEVGQLAQGPLALRLGADSLDRARHAALAPIGPPDKAAAAGRSELPSRRTQRGLEQGDSALFGLERIDLAACQVMP